MVRSWPSVATLVVALRPFPYQGKLHRDLTKLKAAKRRGDETGRIGPLRVGRAVLTLGTPAGKRMR
jgi:hypothetical protein